MKRKSISSNELKETFDSWGFSQATLSGDLLFIGGQVGICADGSIPTDPATQMEQAFINLEGVLKTVGASFDDVVDLTAFYTHYKEHGQLARPIRDKYLGKDKTPNWTAIGVAALAEPFVFEMKAVARIPNK